MTPWQLLWEWLTRTYPVIMVSIGQVAWTAVTAWAAYRIARWRYHHRIEDHLPEVAKAHIKKLHSENRSLRRWIRKQHEVEEDMLGALNGIQRLSSGNWRVLRLEDDT